MALSVNPRYLQVGPRQGVYIRPGRLHAPRSLGITGPPFLTAQGGQAEWCEQPTVLPAPLKWKRYQFKNPSESYKYRARVEPPGPPSPQGSSVQALMASRPKLGRPIPPRSSSCTDLRQSIPRPPPQPKEHNRSQSFNVTARAVVMQPRLPQRLLATQRPPIVEQPYSYPDPTNIRGNMAFDIRISELARLQSDTVRYEESMQRIYGNLRRIQHNSRTVSRPTSARDPQRKFTSQTAHRQSLPGILERSSGANPRPGPLLPQYSNSGTQNQLGRRRPQSAKISCSGDTEPPDQTANGLSVSTCTSSICRRMDAESSRPNRMDRDTAVSETKLGDDLPLDDLESPANVCAGGTGTSTADSGLKDTSPTTFPSELGSSEAQDGNQEHVEEQNYSLDGTCEHESLLEDSQASPEAPPDHPLPQARQNGAGKKKDQAGEARSKKAKAKSPGGRSHLSLKVDRVSSTTSVSSSTSQCSREKSKSSSQARRRGNHKSPSKRKIKSGAKE